MRRLRWSPAGLIPAKLFPASWLSVGALLAATSVLPAGGCALLAEQPPPLEPAPPPVVAAAVTLDDSALKAAGFEHELTRRRLAEKRREVIESGKRRIALLAPLSGKYAALGDALLDAAEMALFDFAGDGIDLMTFDSRGDGEGALEAWRRAGEAGAEIIIGPVFSEAVKALRGGLEIGGAPLLALTSDVSLATTGLFIFGYDVEEELRTLLSHARQHDAVRFVTVATNDRYGKLVSELARKTVAEHDALLDDELLYRPGRVRLIQPQIKKLTNFDQRDALYQRQLERFGLDEDNEEHLDFVRNLKQRFDFPFDAVILPLSGQDLQAAAAFLAYYDATTERVRLLGTSAWEDEAILREPLLHGGWFTATPIGKRRQLAARYRELFKRDAPRIASLLYDAVGLSVSLMKRHPAVTLELLTRPEGFKGVNGLFRLKDDGRVERAYTIYEVRRSGFKPVMEGAARFTIAQETKEPQSEGG